MNCPSCHGANPDAAKFCNHCGAALGTGCPSCAHPNPPGSRFCNACGAALNSSGADAGVRPAPAPATAALPPLVPAAAAAAAFAALVGPNARMPTGPLTRGGVIPHDGQKPLGGSTAMAGERKQVTVMFADVKDFTSMSEQLDPEDMHGIMNRCFEVLVKEVHRYEGTINQFTGDGIMALFGAPIARTDSPQRAVLAALSVQNALENLADDLQQERGISFRMRIGLNTGMAVVGAVGTDTRQDYTAVGDTTNLAARMEQMAEPGTILISEHTYRLVQHDFTCEELGVRQVKGRAEPVTVYKVIGLAIGHAHDGLHEGETLTPFTGREEELRVLRKHVERALAGEGRVIGVVGETGVGKSRLIHELLAGLDRTRIAVAQGHCLSYGAGIAYMPFKDMLRDLRPCPPEAPCDAGVLHDLIAHDDTVSTPGPGLDGFLVGSQQEADQRGTGAKRAVFDGLLDILFEATERAPLLLVIEDLQWIDSVSQDLLGALIRGLAGKRLCLICTFTSGYHFPWADRTYYRHLTLDRLSSESTAAVVRALLGGTRVPPELLKLVHQEAEGNPFYIEASLRMLQEDGFLEQTSEGVRIARPLSEVNIPDSIQEIVMAKIDRLDDPVKRALQVAAVIGRVFEVDLLTAVLEAEGIAPQLDALIAAELITSHGLGEYAFRQGVTRDVAYNSMLRSRRRELHARVGRALEWLHGDRVDQNHARIGYHFAEGGEPARAVGYLQRAARNSLRIGAVHEGADELERALALLDELPAETATAELRVDLLQEISELRFLGGALEDSVRIAREAQEIAETHDLRQKLGRLYINIGGIGLFGLTSRDEALDRLKAGLQLCEEAHDERPLARGYMHLGNALRQMGSWAEAEGCFQRMIDISERHPETFGQVVGRCMLATVATETGHLQRAHQHTMEALAAAERSENEWAVAFASAFGSDVFLELGDLNEAQRLAERGVEMGERLNVPFATTNARATLGRVAFARHDFRKALKHFKENLVQSGTIVDFSTRVRLGETALELGRVAQAHRYATSALDTHPSSKDVGRAERLLAATLLRQRPPDLQQARKLIDRAVERFQTLEMPLELGASLTVQGLLYRAEGNKAAAHDCFDHAHELFQAAGARWRDDELVRQASVHADAPVGVL